MDKPIRLDIGCGRNKISKDFTGIDIVPPADIVMDVSKEKLPFADGSVEEVYCSHVIEHVEDPIFVIKEIYRVLKKNGKIIMQFPHFTEYRAHNQFHRFMFSAAILDFYDKDSKATVTKELNQARFRILRKQIMVYRTILLPYTYIVSLVAKISPDFYEKFLCYLAPSYNVRITAKKI